MDTQKYNRLITLLCPTCGHSQFSSISPDNSESELQKCTACGREITRDELINENSENIGEHLNEIKNEVTKNFVDEFKNKLTSAFKDNKFIKIK